MATRLYFMPAITEIRNGRLTTHPKYDNLYFGAQFQNMNFGSEPFFLVGADLTDTQHTTVALNSDVITIPVGSLDVPMTGTWTTVVKPLLETMRIPADWIAATQTHRFSLAIIARMFQFLQRLEGVMGSSLFAGAVTLDTPWNTLTQAVQTSILNAATSLNMDTTWITNTIRIRQVMKGFADRWSGGPIQIIDIIL